MILITLIMNKKKSKKKKIKSLNCIEVVERFHSEWYEIPLFDCQLGSIP